MSNYTIRASSERHVGMEKSQKGPLTPLRSTPTSTCPGEMQLMRTPVPFSTGTPALTPPRAACAVMVLQGPQHPPYVEARLLMTMMLPYFWLLGAALVYAPLPVSLAMAGGAYLRAKKGASECCSKHLCRSLGVVSAMEGGPSSPDEQTQTSSLPNALSTSSMRTSVSSSSVTLNG